MPSINLNKQSYDMNFDEGEEEEQKIEDNKEVEIKI